MVIVGFNDNCSWGCTMRPRRKDYYRIQFKMIQAGIFFNGKWENQNRIEEINIKGSPTMFEPWRTRFSSGDLR